MQKIKTDLRVEGDVTLNEADTVGVKLHANGALQIGLLGGDALGEDAVCLQANRDNANEVAIGIGSVAIGKNARAAATNSGHGDPTGGCTAIGMGATATASGYYGSSQGSLAIGNGASATGERSTALGINANASGNSATAIGYFATASQTNSGAFGYRAKSATANVQELAYWSGSTVRAGAVRVHGTGMVALTIQDRSSAYDDGGATAGSEADNTLIREGYAIRRNGDVILIDVNIGGTVKTLSLGTAT